MSFPLPHPPFSMSDELFAKIAVLIYQVCMFQCVWDSGERVYHYKMKERPAQQELAIRRARKPIKELLVESYYHRCTSSSGWRCSSPVCVSLVGAEYMSKKNLLVIYSQLYDSTSHHISLCMI